MSEEKKGTDNQQAPQAPAEIPQPPAAPAPQNVKRMPPLSALQRVEVLEAEVRNLRQAIQGVEAANGALDEALGKQVRFSSALCRVLKESRAITMENINGAAEENALDRLRSPIDALTKAGILAPSAAVSERSVIVGRELKKGTREPVTTRAQMAVGSLVKGIKDKLIGKRVGDEVELVDGVLFALTEIHDLQEPKRSPAPPAPPAQAPDAGVPPAAATPTEGKAEEAAPKTQPSE